MVLFLLEFRRKIIDFGVLFDAITFGVTIFCPTLNVNFTFRVLAVRELGACFGAAAAAHDSTRPNFRVGSVVRLRPGRRF